MADIFHTFFGISGLSLLGYFATTAKINGIETEVKSSTHFESYNEIDPTYALPRYLVEKLGLFKQILDKV